MANKQYGLIIPKKSKQATVKKLSVFENDSEEEKELNSGSKSAETKIDTWKSKIKKKSQLEIQKIMEEDPTVYEYDSIYDDMQKEKEEKTAEIKPKDKKPKYVNSLMKAAESRKKEYERRIERSIQKEREEEGDQFKDKEAFVTSAYKKKMLEMQEQEEKERREREAEERNDVTKQKDLSGFYRQLLKQTTGKATTAKKETDNSADKQNSSKDADNGHDNKQSAELIRARKAVEELMKNSSRKKRKQDSGSSDTELHKQKGNSTANKRRHSEDESSSDSGKDENPKPSVKKQKSRHENMHKHKKAKHRHSDSDSEAEVRHRRKHKRSKHSKSSHRDEKEKRRDKHRSHHKEKHKRPSRHSSDSESD